MPLNKETKSKTVNTYNIYNNISIFHCQNHLAQLENSFAMFSYGDRHTCKNFINSVEPLGVV